MMTNAGNRIRQALLEAISGILLATAAAAASPAPPPPAAPCPQGNLLATARLSDSLDVRGAITAAVDDAVAPEGAAWNAQQGIWFETGAGSVTFDLGASLPIAAVFAQCNSRDAYSFQVSDDGESFREVWAVPAIMAEGRGMRSRSRLLEDVTARYVRFGEGKGSDPFALSELQVFCAIPALWPPLPRVEAAPPSPPPAPRPWYQLNPRSANAIKMVLALLGAALLAWGYVLKRRGAPERGKRVRDALLIALGLLGYTGYYNWGLFHFPIRTHAHEFFHYYVGSKYFPELGYTGLYECACLAEAEDGFRRRVELRKIRDVSANELRPATYVLEDPERFKRGFSRPFTVERWRAFKHDVAFFRERMGIVAWERALQDHGYNPSPAWTMTGSALANLAPASDGFIDGVLGWIDPVLVLVAFAFITWAFGWRTACVAALFFGTNEPGLYYWTGGSYIRQDWLMWAVVGISLLKRGKHMLGGAGLAVSTLLRVFPGGFFVPVGLRLLWILFKERRVDREGARIVAGAALATLLLVAASSAATGGLKAWLAFAKNTAKHASTPLTNYMGLRTIVGFRLETRQKVTYDPTLSDPFEKYKEAHREVLRGGARRTLYVVLVGAYVALLLYGLRREKQWWVPAALGFGVIAVLTELTCYYYTFLLVAAFLGERRDEIPIGLLALAAASLFIDFSTFYMDMRYVMESVAALGFVAWATWLYAMGTRDATPPSPRPTPAPAG